MIPWLGDEMVVACHPDHPLAANENNLSLSDLEHSEWILREPGSGTREYFLGRLAPRLEHWHQAFELNNTEAIINCTAAGLGLTLLVAPSRRTCRERQPPDNPATTARYAPPVLAAVPQREIPEPIAETVYRFLPAVDIDRSALATA